MVVDVEGEGETAKFTFRGEEKVTVADAPPIETAGGPPNLSKEARRLRRGDAPTRYARQAGGPGPGGHGPGPPACCPRHDARPDLRGLPPLTSGGTRHRRTHSL